MRKVLFVTVLITLASRIVAFAQSVCHRYNWHFGSCPGCISAHLLLAA